eukprot:TRINITY_DN1121_c1_g4_i1.p1 TRINITY_DN1121_c1_g4~~TRINITY_DN1121_c1_g4_i1.p1  ORF type:complete len:132 (+),score=27.26 TRINITY_DN1121_c1_g4_i1:69-464(+)
MRRWPLLALAGAQGGSVFPDDDDACYMGEQLVHYAACPFGCCHVGRCGTRHDCRSYIWVIVVIAAVVALAAAALAVYFCWWRKRRPLDPVVTYAAAPSVATDTTAPCPARALPGDTSPDALPPQQYSVAST